MLGDTQLCRSLLTFALKTDNKYDFGEPSAILYSFSRLIRLEIPVDMMYELSVLPGSFGSLPIHDLVLLKPRDQDGWNFEAYGDGSLFINSIYDDLLDALSEDKSLSNLWTLGVDPRWLPWNCQDQEDEIDNKILRHLDVFPDDILDDMMIEEIGIYWNLSS